MFLSVFAASMLGIWSRPTGFIASVWPANAVMLGLLVRLPAARRPLGWLAGFAGFMAADLITGSPLLKASLLNGTNIIGIYAGFAVLARLPKELIRLRQPLSMQYVVGASLTAGIAAAVPGALINLILFDSNLLSGFMYWSIGETVNYITVLPIFLSAPSLRTLYRLGQRNNWRVRRHDLLPGFAVILSCFAAVLIGGPGAIAFPVLALLWVGLEYPVFPTTILTLFCSLFVLVFIASGHLMHAGTILDEQATISIRLGTAIITIAPITLAVVTQSRNELLRRLRHMSTHDPLTLVTNRAAFREQAENIFKHQGRQHAALMIDLDHFKSINDTYGHAAGDEVLREATRRIRKCLRPHDLIGRMGGEEFAVFLPNCQEHEARNIAERIRTALAATPVQIAAEQAVPITTSIGVSVLATGHTRGLDALLAEADRALYISKQSGRNRVECAV